MSRGGLPGPGPLAELRLRLSQERIAAYADASGDHNPIHLDPEFARRAGLPSTIAHGLLTLGVVCALAEGALPDGVRVARVACRFSAPVASGEELCCRAEVTESEEELARVRLSAATAAGQAALSRGAMELRPL